MLTDFEFDLLYQTIKAVNPNVTNSYKWICKKYNVKGARDLTWKQAQDLMLYIFNKHNLSIKKENVKKESKSYEGDYERSYSDGMISELLNHFEGNEY